MSVKSILEKIAASFQPAADKVEKWDCPALRAFNKAMWDKLDTKMKDSISALALALYTKYGEQVAKDIMSDLKARLEKIIKQ
jgi:hypothetical protein